MCLSQLAKKHADKMPIQESLRKVAAASRLALGPLQAEVADLRRSLTALQRILTAMPDQPGDTFKQVSQPLDYNLCSHLGLIRCLLLIARGSTQHHMQRFTEPLTHAQGHPAKAVTACSPSKTGRSVMPHRSSTRWAFEPARDMTSSSAPNGCMPGTSAWLQSVRMRLPMHQCGWNHSQGVLVHEQSSTS